MRRRGGSVGGEEAQEEATRLSEEARRLNEKGEKTH
jgi:hypothetical protein